MIFTQLCLFITSVFDLSLWWHLAVFESFSKFGRSGNQVLIWRKMGLVWGIRSKIWLNRSLCETSTKIFLLVGFFLLFQIRAGHTWSEVSKMVKISVFQNGRHNSKKAYNFAYRRARGMILVSKIMFLRMTKPLEWSINWYMWYIFHFKCICVIISREIALFQPYLYESFQSAYRKGNSAETALLRVKMYIDCALD